MTWILTLAGSGGTAGSQGGHETRRHRVRGAFPIGASLLVAATLALAGCGSSSNSIGTDRGSGEESSTPTPTDTAQTKPKAPIIGGLIASSESESGEDQKIVVNVQSEDNEDSESEENQQHKIVVNIQPNPEEESEDDEDSESEENQQHKIVVNIQPNPEEESEDDEDSESEENQQHKIVVNIQPNPEEESEDDEDSESEENQQHKIVVNIQPNPEEESEDNEESEETPQQLTIIEQPEPTYIPPEKPKYKYEASHGGSSHASEPDCMTVCHRVGDIETGDYTFSYGIWLSNDPSENNMAFLRHYGSTGKQGRLHRGLKDFSTSRKFSVPGLKGLQDVISGDKLTVKYYKQNGFRGHYLYNGEFGTISGDVNLTAVFDDGEDIDVTGTLANNITMNGLNFGNLHVTSLGIDFDTGIGKAKAILGSKASATSAITATIGIPTANNMEAIFSDVPTYDPTYYEPKFSSATAVYVSVAEVNGNLRLVYAGKSGYGISNQLVDMTGRFSRDNPLKIEVWDVNGNIITDYERVTLDNVKGLSVLDAEALSQVNTKLVNGVYVFDNSYLEKYYQSGKRLIINRVGAGAHKVHYPNRLAGEVKLTNFNHTSDTTSTASKNALYGVFVGEVHGKKPKR